jgi:hypothetical protein
MRATAERAAAFRARSGRPPSLPVCLPHSVADPQHGKQTRPPTPRPSSSATTNPHLDHPLFAGAQQRPPIRRALAARRHPFSTKRPNHRRLCRQHPEDAAAFASHRNAEATSKRKHQPLRQPAQRGVVETLGQYVLAMHSRLVKYNSAFQGKDKQYRDNTDGISSNCGKVITEIDLIDTKIITQE